MMTQNATTHWLKDRSFDLTFILGLFLLAISVAGVALYKPSLFIPLMLADLWLLGYHHVVATYTRFRGKADERSDQFTYIALLLPIVLLSTFVLGLVVGVKAIVTIYFFWQWFHYVRQSWGIAQRYRRQSGIMAWDSERLSEITLWSVPIAGLLYRCAQGWTEFLTLPLYMPAVPMIVALATLWISAALVLYWIITRVAAYRRGQLCWGHTLFMASHLAVFALAYGFIEDINMGWLLVNVWHNSQYVSYVWLYNRQRFQAGVIREAPVLSALSQQGAGRAIAYYAACILFSTLLYKGLGQLAAFVTPQLMMFDATLEITTVIILFAMTLNFHHYLVDSFIWKRKRMKV